jgi:hypothetical protein
MGGEGSANRIRVDRGIREVGEIAFCRLQVRHATAYAGVSQGLIGEASVSSKSLTLRVPRIRS